MRSEPLLHVGLDCLDEAQENPVLSLQSGNWLCHWSSPHPISLETAFNYVKVLLCFLWRHAGVGGEHTLNCACLALKRKKADTLPKTRGKAKTQTSPASMSVKCRETQNLMRKKPTCWIHSLGSRRRPNLQVRFYAPLASRRGVASMLWCMQKEQKITLADRPNLWSWQLIIFACKRHDCHVTNKNGKREIQSSVQHITSLLQIHSALIPESDSMSCSSVALTGSGMRLNWENRFLTDRYAFKVFLNYL